MMAEDRTPREVRDAILTMLESRCNGHDMKGAARTDAAINYLAGALAAATSLNNEPVTDMLSATLMLVCVRGYGEVARMLGQEGPR